MLITAPIYWSVSDESRRVTYSHTVLSETPDEYLQPNLPVRITTGPTAVDFRDAMYHTIGATAGSDYGSEARP